MVLATAAILLLIAAGLTGCEGGGEVVQSPSPSPSPTPAPTIPLHFTTYTDDLSLFSISYPPDWEPALWILDEVAETVSDLVESLESGIPIENIQYVFLAGLPAESGWNPNVNIVVEPMPAGAASIDSVAEAEVRGIKTIAEEYHEFSRTRTTVGGREAAIIDMLVLWPEMGEWRVIQMYVIHGGNVWIVTCTAEPEAFDSYEDAFHDIVNSFRILK